jgi:hypothetical protein
MIGFESGISGAVLEAICSPFKIVNTAPRGQQRGNLDYAIEMFSAKVNIWPEFRCVVLIIISIS